MKKLLFGLVALTIGWLWSRGARDPREWPTRLPQELAALWDDLDDAFAAGRRAAAREEQAFEERMRIGPADRD